MLYYNYKMIKKNKKTTIILTILAFISLPLCIFLSDYIKFEKDSNKTSYESCNNYAYFYAQAEQQLRKQEMTKIYNVDCSYNGVHKNGDKDGVITIKCTFEHRTIFDDITYYKRNLTFNCSYK